MREREGRERVEGGWLEREREERMGWREEVEKEGGRGESGEGEAWRLEGV